MRPTYTSFSTQQTPQSEPIPGQKQVPNEAGGYVYQLDDWKAFERFLILGTEGGTYYVGERKLTRDNAIRTMGCIAADGRRAVDLIVDISDKGRAPKNDPAIFALALTASADDVKTRQYALDHLHKVCRIPTHLFHFNTFVEQFRGRGRSLNSAVRDWYQLAPLDKLAFEMVKYQQRDGWSHRDLLRLCHPHPLRGRRDAGNSESRNALYRWATSGGIELADDLPPEVVLDFEAAKTADKRGLIKLIRERGLVREMVPTESLTDPDVWEALLMKMPPTAMIRNLGNMSKVGLLKPLSEASKTVVAKLADGAGLKKKRVHPIEILIALKTYSQGHGMRGSGQWVPVPAVIDALNDAFYTTFGYIEPSKKRILYGIDTSGSMWWDSSTIRNTPICAAEGAAVMAMACARVEEDYYIMAFSTGMKQIGITNETRLVDALEIMKRLGEGGTDCSLPMLWAMKEKINVDAFILLTDNETWAGYMHPSQALEKYRKWSGIQDAKEVVVGMTATNFTVADPKDPNTLDVVGFDTSTPQAISEFVKG